MNNNSSYETVIGLEIHIELFVATKMFCGCSVGFGGAPNTRVCPVCLGMPGALPTPNKKAVEYAVALGSVLNCNISRINRFDRKNYYYPDNPQNYQISQLYIPICTEGRVTINNKTIRIHEMHMEEDAGKLIHDNNKTYIDYNRAGVPLLEIVTEPDMRDADEVVLFLQKLRDIIRYLDISDCKMNEGSMRVDVNLSVRKTDDNFTGDTTKLTSYEGDEKGRYGTRTEMKNLNSFRSVKLAIESESKRQIELLKSGKNINQETRRWDDDTLNSYTMRSKEDSSDYRYFPEPDIPDIHISEELIRDITGSLPELREDRVKRYMDEYGLSEYDALSITEYKNISEIFEDTLRYSDQPKKVANYLMGEAARIIKEENMNPEAVRLDTKGLSRIIELAQDNNINSTAAKEVFGQMFMFYNQDVDDLADAKEIFDVEEYIKKHDLSQLGDDEELRSVITGVIDGNTESVRDYLSGKVKAMGYLVGQTMKATAGKADPVKTKEIMAELLEERR